MLASLFNFTSLYFISQILFSHQIPKNFPNSLHSFSSMFYISSKELALKDLRFCLFHHFCGATDKHNLRITTQLIKKLNYSFTTGLPYLFYYVSFHISCLVLSKVFSFFFFFPSECSLNLLHLLLILSNQNPL